MPDELGRFTDAVTMYQAILDEAEQNAWYPRDPGAVDAETELRTELPWLLGRLSPSARALLREHLGLSEDMVAAFWVIQATVSTRPSTP